MQATISNITKGSLSESIGLKKGDSILSINDHPVRDIIDLMFYSRDPDLNIKVKRNESTRSFKLKNNDGDPLGIELKSFRTKSCRNKCMFCFVNQLPKGMRKSLYLKDDDYRMSFLFGNYITLTNLAKSDIRRIIEQRLSPLYVSVHSTDIAIRRKLLGNPKAPDIMQEIQKLTDNRIRIHAQIVVCPGINDGDNLSSTIRDLEKFYPYVTSVAVVPVGITRFSKSRIKPVDKAGAARTIEIVKTFRRRFKRRHGDPIVYLSDEFYIKASLPLPPVKEYGDLPQIENGVGLVPSFVQEARSLKLPKKIKPARFAIYTGVSFMPYLREFSDKLLSIEGLELDLFTVENKYFGQSVTVAGLLTGKDIVRTVLGKTRADCLLVPHVALKNGADVFLDNVTIKDIKDSLGINVKIIEPTPSGLLRGIVNEC